MTTVEVTKPQSIRHIEGSIDLSAGDLQCPGDLVVDGNILDGRAVRAIGSIRVAGVIQAATVHAGGDLHADGGISGRDRADCRAGGDLWSRYIVNAKVEAEGTVHVASEILSSEVTSGGDVIVEAGALVGGRISAAGIVRCRKVGSHGTATVVAAGVDCSGERTAISAIAEIDSSRKRAAKIREVVAPLLKNQKALTPQQKEKATELLFEAENLDASVNQILTRLRGRCQSLDSRPSPQIQILESAVAGVHIRIADLEAKMETSLYRPVSILIRGTGSARRIVVVDEEEGVLELPTRPVSSEGAQILQRIRAA